MSASPMASLLPPKLRRRLGVVRRRLFGGQGPYVAPNLTPAEKAARLAGKILYFGNLGRTEPQYADPRFIGLALNPVHDREIRHDAFDALPVPDGSVAAIQAQDVFEHLAYDRIPAIFDDIHRALAPGGRFRLSVPDYRSPVHLRRSVFDENGEVIADLRMGGHVAFDPATAGRRVDFEGDGIAHLWFPTYDTVRSLIERSALATCTHVRYLHYFRTRAEPVTEPFDNTELFVQRSPPNDMRAGGSPVSIIVDFVK